MTSVLLTHFSNYPTAKEMSHETRGDISRVVVSRVEAGSEIGKGPPRQRVPHTAVLGRSRGWAFEEKAGKVIVRGDISLALGIYGKMHIQNASRAI